MTWFAFWIGTAAGTLVGMLLSAWMGANRDDT